MIILLKYYLKNADNDYYDENDNKSHLIKAI